jgi:hypothetical protein
MSVINRVFYVGQWPSNYIYYILEVYYHPINYDYTEEKSFMEVIKQSSRISYYIDVVHTEVSGIAELYISSQTYAAENPVWKRRGPAT